MGRREREKEQNKTSKVEWKWREMKSFSTSHRLPVSLWRVYKYFSLLHFCSVWSNRQWNTFSFNQFQFVFLTQNIFPSFRSPIIESIKAPLSFSRSDKKTKRKIVENRRRTELWSKFLRCAIRKILCSFSLNHLWRAKAFCPSGDISLFCSIRLLPL